MEVKGRHLADAKLVYDPGGFDPNGFRTGPSQSPVSNHGLLSNQQCFLLRRKKRKK
jgi:hypothetical protein